MDDKNEPPNLHPAPKRHPGITAYAPFQGETTVAPLKKLDQILA